MSKLKIIALPLALLMLTLNLKAEVSKEEKEVLDANEGFYKALNVMFTGNAGPMMEVWSHANDITYMGPGGGMQTGWKAIEAEWKKQAAAKLGGRVESSNLHYFFDKDLAVVLNFEEGTNPNTANGPQKVFIRATNIYRKENGKWKMISHHTDRLSFIK